MNNDEVVESRDVKIWMRNERRHRDHDQPAEIWVSGSKTWWVNGERHRENGPAEIIMYGGKVLSKAWYWRGQKHRDKDLPAEVSQGNKFWYRYGLVHRVGGPAIEYANKEKLWYHNGKQHRLDGPAVVSHMGLKWCVHGVTHRDFGLPAITPNPFTDFDINSHFSDEEDEWVIEGKISTKGEAFEWAINNRKKKFGLLILFIVGLVEDDLFTLIKETWI